MDAQPAALGLTPQRVLGYLGANAVLYIAVAFAWGTPLIAGVADLSAEGDWPPLASAAMIVFLVLVFFGTIAFVQLLVYLGALLAVPTRWRRGAAVLLSPLATGVMFSFASNVGEVALVLVGGVVFAVSVWFPTGPPAWWQAGPRPVAFAAAVWIATLAGVAVTQARSAGVRSDLQVTVHHRDRERQYRLACEYDRADRVRGAAQSTTHPGGDRACRFLDDVYEGLFNGAPPLQEKCPPGAPVATLSGRIRSRRVNTTVVGAACDVTWFPWDEARILAPPLD